MSGIKLGTMPDEFEVLAFGKPKNGETKVKREEVALLVLGFAENSFYSPVQIQKALFLINEKMPEIFDDGEAYSFQPYDYGPFDASAYHDIESLERKGLASISWSGRWKTYAISQKGLLRAKYVRKKLNSSQLERAQKISDLVRKLPFRELVAAIYRAYPEMKEKSIFVG